MSSGAAAEPFDVGIRRVRADPHRVLDRGGNRRGHGRIVAGMAAAGDVCRGDEAEQRSLDVDARGIHRLAHVSVQIDRPLGEHAHPASRRSTTMPSR